MLCISRPCRDVLSVVILLSRHCALWSLYRFKHIASLSGRLIVSHAALTALRPVELVPCYACRVPVGTPYSQSCRYHGTAPCGLYRVMHVASLPGRPVGCHITITALRPVACTVLCISRPFREALGVVMLLSRHCALGGLYRVMHIASLSGCPISCHITITALRPVACTVLCISRPCRLLYWHHDPSR